MIVVLNLFDIVCGMEKQYAEYLRRVEPILQRYGAQVLLYGLTRMVYLGGINQEYCGLVAYPDLEALKRLSHDKDFVAIRPMREASTRNYVLTVIESFQGLQDAARYLENRQT